MQSADCTIPSHCNISGRKTTITAKTLPPKLGHTKPVCNAHLRRVLSHCTFLGWLQYDKLPIDGFTQCCLFHISEASSSVKENFSFLELVGRTFGNIPNIGWIQTCEGWDHFRYWQISLKRFLFQSVFCLNLLIEGQPFDVWYSYL